MSKNNKIRKKRKHKFLKAIGRVIYRFFEFIYKVIDKIIITPVSKIIFAIGNLLKNNNKPVERLLNNKMFLLAFSLALALGAFFIIDSTSNIIINSTADIITNVPVTATYDTNSYVVEGIPDTVDVVLVGRKADIYLTKQYPITSITLDLSNKKPRSQPYEIKLKYNGAISSVEYKTDPSVAYVMIYEKYSKEITIDYEILNIDNLNVRYSIYDVDFADDNIVCIAGKEEAVESVATVKALIDINELDNAKVGDNYLEDISLVAYDNKGEKVDVEIQPATVSATLKIESQSKTVPLKVVPSGEVVFGKAIESMTLSSSTITIYGAAEDLEKVSYVPVNINVDNLSKNKEYNVNLVKPSGVRDLSISSVTVKVTLTEITEKTITGVPITIENLDVNYTAQAATKEDSTVDVIVKGTATNLANITADDITVIVDLSNVRLSDISDAVLAPITVKGSDLRLTYTAEKQTIQVKITRK